jgi:hypothetical protein
MTAEGLAALAGVALSLALSYIPGLKDWYDGLGEDKERRLMGGLLVVVAGAIFALSCGGLGPDLGISVECSTSGALGLVQVLLAALMANQAIYVITKG